MNEIMGTRKWLTLATRLAIVAIAALPVSSRVAFLTEWVSTLGDKPVDALLPWCLTTWANNAEFADFYVLTTNANLGYLAKPYPNVFPVLRSHDAITRGISSLLAFPPIGEKFERESGGDISTRDPHFWTNIRPLLASLFYEKLGVSSLRPLGEGMGDMTRADIHPYDFWGYIENDVYLGNLSAFFPLNVLETHDVLTVQGPMPYGSDYARPARNTFHSTTSEVLFQYRKLLPYGPTFFPNTALHRGLWREAETAARSHGGCRSGLCSLAEFAAWNASKPAPPSYWWADIAFPAYVQGSLRARRNGLGSPPQLEAVISQHFERPDLRVYRACCAIWGSTHNHLGGDIRTDGCRKLWINGEVTSVLLL